MNSYWFPFLLHMSIIACGLVAGVFLTFSDFVMKSLAASKDPGGIEAMQIINRKVMPTVFMVLLLGMAAVAPILGSYAFVVLPTASAAWIIAGSAAYIFGVFLVTVLFNVPMNTRLGKLDNTSPEAAVYWRHYVPRWSAWNHVRTLASVVATVCLLTGSIGLIGGV